MDLASLTQILDSRYHCCVHVCRESQNVATTRLDDVISMLYWEIEYRRIIGIYRNLDGKLLHSYNTAQ